VVVARWGDTVMAGDARFSAGSGLRRAASARPRGVKQAVLAFALVVAFGSAFDAPSQAALQTTVIFPGHATQGQPEAEVKPPAGTELVKLKTSRGERIVALFGPALTSEGSPLRNASAAPTIVFFYGNAMCLSKSVEELETFRRLGANVLIPEYVGYGLSEGRPSETGCYDTADAALAYLLTRSDVNPRRIVAAGWSLGAAVAVDLASRKPVAGLATFSAFTSMTDLARKVFPYLPASLLVQHRFKSERKIAKITCPVLIVHGRDDPLIPPEMSDRLAAAAKGKVTHLTIDGAGHNDLFSVGAVQIREAFGRFLDRVP
jgi:uncharacterized protein